MFAKARDRAHISADRGQVGEILIVRDGRGLTWGFPSPLGSLPRPRYVPAPNFGGAAPPIHGVSRAGSDRSGIRCEAAIRFSATLCRLVVQPAVAGDGEDVEAVRIGFDVEQRCTVEDIQFGHVQHLPFTA